MGPRSTQNLDTKDTPPDASPAAALRYAGQGFLLGFLLCAILAGVLMWLLRRPAPSPIVLHPPPTAFPTETPVQTATPGPLVVFVSGGVHSPAMFELPAGARVGGCAGQDRQRACFAGHAMRARHAEFFPISVMTSS